MFLHAILSVSYAFPTGLTFPRKRSLPKAFYNTVLKNFYVSSLTALNTIDQLIPYFWWPSPSLTLFNSIFTLFFYFTTCFYPPHYPLIAPSLFGFFNSLLQRRNERKKNKKTLSDFWQETIENSCMKIFFRGFRDIILVKNLFKPIKVINRTNSLRIWKSARKNRCHWKKADYDSSRAH